MNHGLKVNNNVLEITLPDGIDIEKVVVNGEEFVLSSAEPERAVKDCRNCKHGNYNDHWDTYFCYHSGDCNDWDKWEPSAQPEQWETCFDCPLSHGCPVINGCTNEQAMEYAGEIPDNCPLSAEPQRKKGKWIDDGDIPKTCSCCHEDWD